MVTGSASGIGAALTTELAAGRAEVWLAHRQIGQAEALAQRLIDAGATAHAIELDVRDGRDRLVQLDGWNDVFDVNLRGVVPSTRSTRS